MSDAAKKQPPRKSDGHQLVKRELGLAAYQQAIVLYDSCMRSAPVPTRQHTRPPTLTTRPASLRRLA